MSVIWEELPEPTSKEHAPLKRFLGELRERPGQWGRYPKTYSQSTMVSILRKNHPDYEFTHRRQEDGRFAVYGRYVGGES